MRALHESGYENVATFRSSEFDLTREEDVARMMASYRPEAIVHLAALPSVPRSVLDPVASHHANATGTLHVLDRPGLEATACACYSADRKSYAGLL